MSQKLEKVLELLLNEDSDRASELLHQIIVEKSRVIYEDTNKEFEDRMDDPRLPLKGKYVEGGYITHDGILYDADAVFALSENKPVKKFNINELDWVLKYSNPDPKRVLKADLSVPVIIAKDKIGRLTVIDGLHRLQKAKENNLNSMPGIFIDKDELKLALVTKDANEKSKYNLHTATKK